MAKSFRKFTLLIASAMIVTMSALGTTSAKYFLYVGTYGKGIYCYRFDPATGHLDSLGIQGTIENPSWVTVAPGERFLYAVSELEGNAEGAVGAFSIDRRTGALKKLNSRPSGGVAPCYVAVDHTGKMLLAANYTTGGVSVYPIKGDGTLGERSALLTAQGHGPNRDRQGGPHAHEVVITADNRFAYVPDLGLDRIRIYRIHPQDASASENNPPFAKEQPGMGPRHMAFGAGEKYAYVLSELESFVTVFSHDASNGSLTEVQRVSTLPAGYQGFNGPAEIVTDRQGKFVYATNRGANTIAVFAVDTSSGKLQERQNTSSEGDFPRGFALDPSGRYAFAGNQKSNDFSVFRVDQGTGKLAFTGEKISVSAPVSFAFVAAE
jgi:6-phosphogluconolactonase